MAKLGEGKEAGNMVAVGATDAKGVRLWFRSKHTGKHNIVITRIGAPAWKQSVGVTIAAGNKSDNTAAFHYPKDFPGMQALESGSLYKYRITRASTNSTLGQGHFETAPKADSDTPNDFSFGIMSCHQPFNSDGKLSEPRMRMLKHASKAFAAHGTKFVIAAGDQMYSDAPGEFSLKRAHYFENEVLPVKGGLVEASASQVRHAYQQRYRQFWQMPELRKIYQDNPCYPILDDHELLDDWGSLRAHKSMAYASIHKGAREAYRDYQGGLVDGRKRLPSSFHYTFGYGRLAGFAMDLRSERKANSKNNTIYSTKQFDALSGFLKKNAKKHVLVIVTSVPVVHIPHWIANAGNTVFGNRIDFLDQWSFEKNARARDKLLGLIHAHHSANPTQRILLVGGDVHIAAAFAIKWQGGSRPTTYQFTSSAISNRLSGVDAWSSKLGPKSVDSLSVGQDGPTARVSLIKGEEARNPFGGLNVGVVQVVNRGEHSTVRFRLLGYAKKTSKKHKTIFDTGHL